MILSTIYTRIRWDVLWSWRPQYLLDSSSTILYMVIYKYLYKTNAQINVLYIILKILRMDSLFSWFIFVLIQSLYINLCISIFWMHSRWKNNIERKSKFSILQRDAAYHENKDDKKTARWYTYLFNRNNDCACIFVCLWIITS